MPKAAKRRFVELDTGEVSLVDTPANEVEFLVKKNQEDEEMGAQAAQTNADDAVRVPVEVEGGEAVAKAMEHVNGIVDKIFKMVPTAKADDDTTTTDDDADDSADDADDVDTEKATVKGVLAAMGLKGKAMEQAMAKLKKAGFDPNMKFPSAKAPVSKSADDVEDDDEAVLDDDDQPLTVGAVRKAAAFTPGRVKQLQHAADAIKLVLEAIGIGESPATKTPGVESHPNPSPTRRLAGAEKKPRVKKSADGEDDELATVLKSLGEAVGSLGDRLETIEKGARPASNSVEDDGGTADTDVVETKKSIWSGVLGI